MATATATGHTRIKPSWKKWTKSILVSLIIVFNVGFIAATIFGIQQLDVASQQVPRLPQLMEEVITEPSVIVAKDGNGGWITLKSIATEYRDPVNIEDVPNHVINATLAAEDTRFYEHTGVDLRAIARVMREALSDERSSGASTITMQLAKRVYTGSERSINRKIKDMSLAIMIERMLAKDQILQLYMNQVFYGQGAYGISAAADVYFNKDLDELTVGEAALLARCVRRPSDENPIRNPEKALQNRDVVLRIMRNESMITEAEYQEAKAEDLSLAKQRPVTVTGQTRAPYFTDYVLHVLRTQYPEIDLKKGGYRIETTINMGMQAMVDKEVKETVKRYKGFRVNEAGFFMMDKQGRILSMMGGSDYNRSQFNMAYQGQRQPGSAFKPFVYATAFDRGALSARGTVNNGDYMIRMGNGRRRPARGGGAKGPVPVSTAVAFSYNRAAYHAITKVGPANVVHAAKEDYGFVSPLKAVPALALGSESVSLMEMARGYTVFQSGGDRVEPYAISRIIGPDGRPVAQAGGRIYKNVINKTAAKDMDALLRRVVVGGTATRAGGVVNARGKTGTTQNNKDAWFCGYTDELIGIAWLSNPEYYKDAKGNIQSRHNTMSYGAMGGKISAPFWARIMSKATKMVGEKRRHVTTAAAGNVVRPPAPGEEDEGDDDATPTPSGQQDNSGIDPHSDSGFRETTGGTGGQPGGTTGEGGNSTPPAAGTTGGTPPPTGGTTGSGGNSTPPDTGTTGGGATPPPATTTGGAPPTPPPGSDPIKPDIAPPVKPPTTGGGGGGDTTGGTTGGG